MISHTAQLLSARRALAHDQKSSIIRDRFAQYFCSSEYIHKAKDSDAPVHYVLLRHRKLDDLYQSRSKSKSQVVLLGAGFDTKYQRLKHDWQKHLEVDTKEMINFKRSILKREKLKEPEFLVSDKKWSVNQFTNNICDALNPNLDTTFIGEGFFMYFSEKDLKIFLKTVLDFFSKKPCFAFDMISDIYLSNENNRKTIERIRKNGENVLTCIPPNQVKDLFLKLEYKNSELQYYYPSDLQAEYLQSTWTGQNDKYVFIALPEA